MTPVVDTTRPKAAIERLRQGEATIFTRGWGDWNIFYTILFFFSDVLPLLSRPPLQLFSKPPINFL